MRKHLFSTVAKLSSLVLLIQITGCSTVPVVDPASPPPMRQLNRDNDQGKRLIDVSDPLEGYNRGAYKFNYGFDKYVFMPVVKSYEFILPNYVEDRVSSFYRNLKEFTYFYNNLLQGKFKSTGVTVGRFAVNTTVGIVGIYDPATHWGMKRRPEDLGQTFGHWGIGSGAYFVIPVMGPSSVRDGIGAGGDALVSNNLGPPSWTENDGQKIALVAVNAVQTRSNIKFQYQQSGSPFEYELIRLFYGMKREADVKQ